MRACRHLPDLRAILSRSGLALRVPQYLCQYQTPVRVRPWRMAIPAAPLAMPHARPPAPGNGANAATQCPIISSWLRAAGWSPRSCRSRICVFITRAFGRMEFDPFAEAKSFIRLTHQEQAAIPIALDW